jgi:hypothetical protein
MQDADLNWIAIVVAAIVPMVLGVLWYSPVLFAQLWLLAVGRTEEEPSGAALGYLLSAVSALLSAYVLARIVKWAEVDDLWNGRRVNLRVADVWRRRQPRCAEGPEHRR